MQLMPNTGFDAAGALERAVLISLFTWRRAEPSDLVDGGDMQGWWGDSYPSVASDRIGSRLWLLRRRSITQQTLLDAQRYCQEALQWLIDDGHVLAVAVVISRAQATQINGQIEITRPDGDPVTLNIEDLMQVKHGI
jgi:phage gp46-like protein